MTAESALDELHHIGIFPNDYTCDDVICYVATLGALFCHSQDVIATLTACVRQLESIPAPCHSSP